jgi:ATP-dependent Clp protease ATP-binding subunit ClpB
MDMQLDVSDEALLKIAEAGFDPLFGARPLKRAIQQYIENPIALRILEGKYGPKDIIPVNVENNEFVFERKVH